MERSRLWKNLLAVGVGVVGFFLSILIGYVMGWPTLGVRAWVIAAALSTLLIVAIVGGYVARWRWTGMRGEYPEAGAQNGQGTRKLWDWLSILIVPVTLAIGGFVFSSAQESQQQAIEEQRARDTAVQDYLDQMSQLMLGNRGQESLLSPQASDEVRTLARARTLTTLSRVDNGKLTVGYRNSHKTAVMQFLQESNVINATAFNNMKVGNEGETVRAIRRHSADVRKKQLHNFCTGDGSSDNSPIQYCDSNSLNGNIPSDGYPVISLREAQLKHSSLRNADLWGTSFLRADLRDADMSDSILVGAFLLGADLRDVDFIDASLIGAELGGSRLSSACFKRAD